MFKGVCLSTGGVPGLGSAWSGECLVWGVPAAGGTHPTGMHSC